MLSLLPNRVIGLMKIGGQVILGKQEVFELFLVNSFQVFRWNFVAAFYARIFLAARRHIHLAFTMAEREPCKKVGGWFSGDSFSGLFLGAQNGVAFLPEFFGYNRLDAGKDPLILRLKFPVFLITSTPSVVGPTHPFGYRIGKQSIHGGISKLSTATSPIAPLVK